MFNFGGTFSAFLYNSPSREFFGNLGVGRISTTSCQYFLLRKYRLCTQKARTEAAIIALYVIQFNMLHILDQLKEETEVTCSGRNRQFANFECFKKLLASYCCKYVIFKLPIFYEFINSHERYFAVSFPPRIKVMAVNQSDDQVGVEFECSKMFDQASIFQVTNTLKIKE